MKTRSMKAGGVKASVVAVVACAMDEEIAPFLAGADFLQPVLDAAGPQDFQRFYLASFGGAPVLLTRSGIGLVNAAVAATRALEYVDTGLYLLAGTTGGLATQVNIGDVIAGTRTLFFEADATAFGYQPGQIPQMPADYHSDTADVAAALTGALPDCHTGTVISGNSFITAANVAGKRQQFPEALAVDMETAAAAQVCHLRGVNWMSLRAVSDLCGPRADQDFHMEAERAAALSYAATTQFLAARSGRK